MSEASDDDTWSAPAPSMPTEALGTEPAIMPEGLVAERYRVVRMLGRGGMGEVYEVDDLELGSRIALKLVRDPSGDDASFAQMKREAQLARKVTHPNVCRLHDFGVHRDAHGRARPFVTMELVRGETLATLLAREHALTTDRALPIATQMAAALDAAHASGVVHGDFKSGNVMLDGERVIVTDFGLARETGGDLGIRETGTAHIVGSPAYMAPEQVEGRPLAPPADVYALGVVLFEMVTGRLPFEERSALATAVKRLRTPPPSPRSIRTDLDPRWDATILACLALDPSGRPPRAGDALARMTAPVTARSRRRVVAPALLGSLALGALALVAFLPRAAIAITSIEGHGAGAAVGRRLEVYDDRATFEHVLASLGQSLRVVNFDDVDTRGPDPVPIGADRYATSHGVVLTGHGEQFVDDGFYYPADFVPVSGRNTFAPGPSAPRDAPVHEGGHETDARFVAAGGHDACVAALGVYFIDADNAAPTGWSVRDAREHELGHESGIVGAQASQIFRGVLVRTSDGHAAPCICSARFVNGNVFPPVDAGEGVVLDDVMLTQPVPL